MDFKIWEDTILMWVKSLGLSQTVSKMEHVNTAVLKEIINIVEGNSNHTIVTFLNEKFPNCNISEKSLEALTDHDSLNICTHILLYVCFTNKSELEPIRKKMCMMLDNSVQENIRDFLLGVQENGDVFLLTTSTVSEEILKFSQRNPFSCKTIGDCARTPVKSSYNSEAGIDSPLMDFLQTPRRRGENKRRHTSSSSSGSDQLKKIKELTDQLVEEELEKASLQEKLNWHEVKCNDYEIKLKRKIEEILDLKNEWEKESTKNENEIKRLNNELEKTGVEREQLKKELSYFENYVSSLEKELAGIRDGKNNLEDQLRNALDKCEEYDKELKRITMVNVDLEEMIKKNEAELQTAKENYKNTYRDESLIDQSYLDEAAESSVTVAENMGVIIEKLLRERTAENESLKGVISEMETEKESLLTEVNTLQSKLGAKTMENSRLHELNKELVNKLDDFVRACKELKQVQNVAVMTSKRFYWNGVNEGLIDLIPEGDATKKSEECLESVSATVPGTTEPSKEAASLYSELDSKVIRVIYDSSKGLTESGSQMSSEDNDTTQLTTIMESLNESEDLFSQPDSLGTSGTGEKNVLEEFHMEELNQEILMARKSLIEFLRASMKNFEVLKIKESLINEMSKQQNNLETRITSLAQLNSRLTKEIVDSKNISEIESAYREKELENLKLEVESLKKASKILKDKLVELERTNEILVSKKEECLRELTLLREKNKSLNKDLQSKVMAQLKQQNSCLGFIRMKQETELEVEKTLKLKDGIDERLADLRKIIPNQSKRMSLEIALNEVEQKFCVASQNLLHTTYLCLKWSAKNIEHQCYLIGQGDNFATDNDKCEASLRREQELNYDALRSIKQQLANVEKELDAIESRCSIDMPDPLSDSLEMIVPSNKTFDIVDVDETRIDNKTFSVGRLGDTLSAKDNMMVKTRVSHTESWVISPPAKAVRKKEEISLPLPKKEKTCSSESWVISPARVVPSSNSTSSHGKSLKSEVTKSKTSFTSTYTQIEYSPTSTKVEAKSSNTSFASATESNPPSKSTSREDFEDATKDDDTTACDNASTIPERRTRSRSHGRDPDAESESSAEFRRNAEREIKRLEKEIQETMEENERLRAQLAECEKERLREKEEFEMTKETLHKDITSKYEKQLEQLKTEMKSLYNRELAKHKAEQSKLSFELKEQNKIYKDHIDELRNQLWDLGEKLLHEQKVKRDLERNLNEMKRKLGRFSYSTDYESKSSQDSEYARKERFTEENAAITFPRHFGNSSFPTIPTEDEDEVFDNRCLEDMKNGVCKVEGPEGRLTELLYRNSLCLPHLKSSYPVETQVHNPKMFKESELKFGGLNFGQESQSLTDSDQSMTRSLLPEEKGKKKEQTSYKKPGPPTPSKNGGRLSIQSGEFRLTPRKVLRESSNDQQLELDRKSTPSRLKALFVAAKTSKRDSADYKDENTAPSGKARGKKLKIFPTVKPFGGRDF